MPGPLAIGLMVGTAAFGIAKLAGASTRTALLAGGLAGLGAGAFAGLGTATKASTLVGKAAKSASMAGGTVPATKLSSIAASTNPFLAAAPGSAGSGVLGVGATTTGGTLGNIAAGAGGLTGTGGAILAPSGGAIVPTALGGSGLPGALAKDLVGTPAMYDTSGAGKVVRPDLAPEGIIRTDTVPTGIVRTGTEPVLSTTERVLKFAKENPLTTAGVVLTGGQMLSDLTAKQPIYDDSTASQFPDMEGELYLRERARLDPTSEREEYVMAPGALTPENVYDRQEEMFAAREGGLATLKLKEGGVNYLPSKSDHDEKDANNYVRAMGYVEDGSGNGDKDEDTMLAQLADGEFVSRADAILGAGIMSGANPDDFKEMRRKGAQFFYKQQDSLKRVYDLVSDANKAS